MKNCIILGSGRSGTSMVAGTLRHAGYYMGDDLLPAKTANPKGFFEAREINRINEDLLAQVTPRRPPGLLGTFFRHRPKTDQRWLAIVPVGEDIPCPPPIAQRITTQTKHSPFCFKDPRFSYTLPCWRPFLRDTVFICVFREPARTVHSILKECREAHYLRNQLSMNYARALRVWTLTYQHILEIHRRVGTWAFIHYEQMLEGPAIPKLEALLNVRVDHQFPDQRLKRSPDNGAVGPQVLAVYRQLCELAGYRHAEANDANQEVVAK